MGIVSFKQVSKSFGDIIALDNVTFDIEKGEFVFIMGPSGAGKTTLLKLILRELSPDSGEIIFDGENVGALAEKDIPFLRQKIGVVFQDFKVLPERTLRENVEVALAVIEVDESEWQGRVDQILKLVGLFDRSELFPAQLSGGELQRVSLARALVVNPKLILADEPTGNLDWETAEGVMDLFEKINKEGKTIIMATHNKMIVEKLNKRVIEIKNGKMVSKESKEKVHTKMKVKVEET
ncbi:MAG: Cell division ATP-binding protein [Candidatus Woesebacteria bacterium GW2011_GWA1_40_45]|uniref:Cell division ATP-binding protein FtsE n=1 Tax=Candidatus Woesebacteria bacterium GW2011_GWA1_40_45 TaxID=1618554 RepID=A0A0G0VJV2_9BACT|nr:MAG: Cell division ATP-binding protein [Candidatus Woesebacteria bacterium GW2011_GWA1_40_45]